MKRSYFSETSSSSNLTDQQNILHEHFDFSETFGYEAFSEGLNPVVSEEEGYTHVKQDTSPVEVLSEHEALVPQDSESVSSSCSASTALRDNIVEITSQLHVLVVDDSEMQRKLTRSKLAGELGQFTWLVNTAENGEQALQVCETWTKVPDVIIIDQIMSSAGGTMLGHEVVTLIRTRSEFKNSVIIGCTGFAEEASRQFFDAGCDAVWIKPMPSRSEAVAQIMEIRKMRQDEIQSKESASMGTPNIAQIRELSHQSLQLLAARQGQFKIHAPLSLWGGGVRSEELFTFKSCAPDFSRVSVDHTRYISQLLCKKQRGVELTAVENTHVREYESLLIEGSLASRMRPLPDGKPSLIEPEGQGNLLGFESRMASSRRYPPLSSVAAGAATGAEPSTAAMYGAEVRVTSHGADGIFLTRLSPSTKPPRKRRNHLENGQSHVRSLEKSESKEGGWGDDDGGRGGEEKMHSGSLYAQEFFNNSMGIERSDFSASGKIGGGGGGGGDAVRLVASVQRVANNDTNLCIGGTSSGSNNGVSSGINSGMNSGIGSGASSGSMGGDGDIEAVGYVQAAVEMSGGADPVDGYTTTPTSQRVSSELITGSIRQQQEQRMQVTAMHGLVPCMVPALIPSSAPGLPPTMVMIPSMVPEYLLADLLQGAHPAGFHTTQSQGGDDDDDDDDDDEDNDEDDDDDEDLDDFRGSQVSWEDGVGQSISSISCCSSDC